MFNYFFHVKTSYLSIQYLKEFLIIQDVQMCLDRERTILSDPVYQVKDNPIFHDVWAY